LGIAQPVRNAELLNYMLQCPAASVSAFLAKRGEAPRGFFLLSHVSGQTRLADVQSAEPQDLPVVYQLATRAAAADLRTCELVAMAPTTMAKAASEAAGLRCRASQPVLTYDRTKKLMDADELNVTMLEGDEVFLATPEYPYLT
jgi:hypothetical protein